MTRQNRPRQKRKILTALIASVALACTPALPAYAVNYGCTEACDGIIRDNDSDTWMEAQEEQDAEVNAQFRRLQTFILRNMWEQNILPVLMEAAAEFTAVAMQQAMTIGMFIDAENQMGAQRLLQEIQAQVHKDYHPSTGMCEFGTMTKSLASTERYGELTAIILSQRSQDRQLGQSYSVGMYGANLDQAGRLLQFRTLFCDERDRGGALEAVCDAAVDRASSSFSAADRNRVNKDIDYFTLLESPRNLSLDFTNQETGTLTSSTLTDADEEHILAMASNLFAHETFIRMPSKLLENVQSSELSDAQTVYMDTRALVAKRSVAENSFNAIAGLKASRNTANADNIASAQPYMQHIMRELGISDADAQTYIGENPSYFAQMEVLTKKIYQNPDFYTNLYDKPANVQRKATAMQAIKLMQKFDMLKSHLREEMTTSMLLETAVMRYQQEVKQQISTMGLTN